MAGLTRIAPTPSGLLHAGNAINFLLTDLLADQLGLQVMLRIDDLDRERVRDRYVEDVLASLEWLGIRYSQGPHSLSELKDVWSQRLRIPRYRQILDDLRTKGHLYACTCTRSSLEGGRYRGHCRERNIPFTDPRAAWRVRVPEDTRVKMRLLDGSRMELAVAELIEDVVVRQRAELDDGRPAYQIASLADDVDRGITHIVRGEDLLPSTALQLYLAEILDLAVFAEIRFLHHPLITDAKGGKLSKSAGAYSLEAMRKIGKGPQELRRTAEELAGRLIRS